MTTPSSPKHLLPLVLLAAALAAALTATADEQMPRTAAPVTLPGCPDKCGDVSIPYPFGMKDGCFLPGFQVTCNDTIDPPRAFLAASSEASMTVWNNYYMSTELQRSHKINESRSLVELMDISVSQGQARAYGSFSFDCSANMTYHSERIQQIYVPPKTPFLVSETGNKFTVIGRSVEAELPSENGVYHQVRTEGRCKGKGWCQEDIPGNTRNSQLSIKHQNNTEWRTSPCSYAMVVDKSWYNFSDQDLVGDGFLQRNVARGVPVVLDFTIRWGSCPAAGQPAATGNACVSGNSSCVDGPIYPGYHCRCSDGYKGNPYIPHGCQDIDECQRPDLYPCHGKCENRLGGYECTCPAGTTGDAKEGKCTERFPLAAKVAVGAIGGLFVLAVLSFLILLSKEKRKTREFFERNGGPTLEKARIIKIFKKEELKPIIESKNFIGKGGFGEVYKGFLGNEQVAVKKPISGSVLHNEQFANEVIIQSQVNHRNIVRLIGCCLEVDIPMLVYEFLSKGSLHDILHNNNNKVPLSLDVRLSIAAESADGLAYMHSKTNTKILHGDVKPANILLDENMVPKISDFGISRLIVIDKQHTEVVIGDKTYIDPVYREKGLLTEKSDVYSFGVTLLELFSGKKASYGDDNSLVRNFLEAHKNEKRATELFDKEIAVAGDLELLESLAGIVVDCLDLDVDQRPEMIDVAERLLILMRSRKSQ